MSTRIALYDASGLLADLLQKLSGSEGKQWLSDLGKFLRKENPWNPRDWAVWKTIKLGRGPKTVDEFREALKKAGNEIGTWGNDILGKKAFTDSLASEEVDAELVSVSVAELGFKEGALFKDICGRAQEQGLYLCPAEVGPQLRLQYEDQPKGEWLVIAMEAITASDGGLEVFDVGRRVDGERDLGGDRGRPGHFWGAGDRFVFLRRK